MAHPSGILKASDYYPIRLMHAIITPCYAQDHANSLLTFQASLALEVLRSASLAGPPEAKRRPGPSAALVDEHLEPALLDDDAGWAIVVDRTAARRDQLLGLHRASRCSRNGVGDDWWSNDRWRRSVCGWSRPG